MQVRHQTVRVQVREVEVRVGREVLDDLRDRLGRTRLPEPATTPGWEQGPPADWLRDLIDHWRTGYDWRRCEARINAHSNVVVEVDGLDLHAVHLPSPSAGATPVVLTHGWPGSFLEYLEVAERLAYPARFGGDPAEACSVVVPSLPGYGFSGRPDAPGWGVRRIADAWVALMEALGYDRFVAAGSDWGTSVSAEIGARHPDAVLGLVLVPPLAPPDPALAGEPTAAERRALGALRQRRKDGSAYSAAMETRPQTIGTALTDSPAGLASWILDKVHDWVDHDGDLFAAVPRDVLLDTVTLYWVTGTAASAGRLYRESIDDVSGLLAGEHVDPIRVPVTGVMFPAEVPWVSRRWAARRFPDIRHWIEPARGGHFGGWEAPEVIADAVREAARVARS